MHSPSLGVGPGAGAGAGQLQPQPQPQPLRRRPSAISIRSQEATNNNHAATTTTNIIADPQSPAVAFFTPDPSAPWPSNSPNLERSNSPDLNHFSTLPPSPPLSVKPPWNPQPHRQSSADSHAPTDVLFGGGSGGGGTGAFLSVVHDDGRRGRASSESGSEASEYISSSRDSVGYSSGRASGASEMLNVLVVDDAPSSKIKRRPSLILTSAPGDESGGSPLSSATIPLPSPRLGRRQYPGESSQSEFNISPVNSPTIPSSTWPGAFLSPTLPTSSSPVLGSTSMARQPSSPRLAAFTEEVGRMAQGLVRRASNSSMNAGLPIAVSRSPSPARVPSGSPTLTAPSLSPLLGSGSTRRGSFAAQARDKEREKEKEVEKRARDKKLKQAHNRMFSWAQRPDDLGAGSGGKPKSSTSLTLKIVILLVLASGFYVWRSSSLAASAVQQAPSPITRGARNPGVRRNAQILRPNRELGALFIHPDVVNRGRPALPYETGSNSPWQWLQSFFRSPPSSPPPQQDGYHHDIIQKSRSSTSCGRFGTFTWRQRLQG